MSAASHRTVVRYLIGVDGGGTGTRLLLADSHGQVLARAQAGPSALALGAVAAWAAIEAAATQAFAALNPASEPADALPWSSCVLACGLAGVNHEVWRSAFVALAPPLLCLTVESDAYTALLGAHQGAHADAGSRAGHIRCRILPQIDCNEGRKEDHAARYVWR